jgi:ribosomal protein L37E
MSEPADTLTLDLVEICRRCGSKTSNIPSDTKSHNYGVTEFGDIMSHTSRVTCPRCGEAALRRHTVPFRVRVP